MLDLFISYARPDRPLAEALAADMEARGLTCWWDSQLLGGDDFRAVIFNRVREAKAIAVIWSDRSIGSRWVIEEAEEAANELKLVAVAAPGFDVARLPLGFRSFQTVPIAEHDRIERAVRAACEGRHDPRSPGTPLSRWQIWARALRTRPELALGTTALVAALALGTVVLTKKDVVHDRPALVSDQWSPQERHLIDLAAKLQGQIQQTITNRSPPLSRGDFAKPLATIEEIRAIDRNNGNIPYFLSVIARWMAPLNQPSEMSHDGFYRYLELEQMMPKSITQTPPETEWCYARPFGYCTQRTAWVNHQLAWDFYRWAQADKEPAVREEHFRRAANYARTSLKLFPPNGFDQGMPDKAILANSHR